MSPVGELPGAPGRARIPWREGAFASLDFETTGLDLSKDAVISFGVVPVLEGRVMVANSVERFIRPEVPPSPRSQTIHELRPQDLATAPEMADVREPLFEALDQRYLLVWYAEVEMHFLQAIFGGTRRGWRRRTIDVRTLAISADGAPPATRSQLGYGLTATAERFGVPVANPHDALDDALVTAQLFITLADRVSGGPEPSVRDLLKIARP
ncbi:MAG: polymerase subunit epsilon [Actinomycetota bacterium]|nr:polymerase subunit epsilon [Actinomycetota bacterium]